MPECVAELLARVHVAEPKTFESLTLFPLLADPPECEAGYYVLDEAVATGRFGIAEVSEAGTVPELRVENRTEMSVFLLDGEELVGAKQNRVLNLSLMMPAGEVVIVPVSCVEAGRWRYQQHDFAPASRAQFARGRA